MAFKRLFSHSGPRFAANWLVVGIGNPGEDYARTRHNIGFWVVNELAKRAGTQLKSTGSTMAIGVGNLAEQRVALIKPKTFVNLSGKAVSQAMQWTGCDLAHTIVLYDDLDLAVGAMRIREGGGAGGHNGLKSIGAAVGMDFVRLRIGIGRPAVNGEPTWESEHVAQYVLNAPQGEDKRALDAAASRAADAVEAIFREGAEAAGSKFNKK